MKIYIADFGWAGDLLVFADSEEEARQMMKGEHPHYQDDTPLEEKEIVKGTIFVSFGDM